METIINLLTARLTAIYDNLVGIGYAPETIQKFFYLQIFNETHLQQFKEKQEMEIRDCMLRRVRKLEGDDEYLMDILSRADCVYSELNQLTKDHSISKENNKNPQGKKRKDKLHKDRRQKKQNEKKKVAVVAENKMDEQNKIEGPFKQFIISTNNIFMKKPLMENKNDGNLFLEADESEMKKLGERMLNREKDLLRNRIMELEMLSELVNLSNMGFSISIGDNNPFRMTRI